MDDHQCGYVTKLEKEIPSYELAEGLRWYIEGWLFYKVVEGFILVQTLAVGC